MNEEQYAEVKAKLASNDTEHGSFRRRLDEHDEKIEKLQQTQILLERLTNAVTIQRKSYGAFPDMTPAPEPEPEPEPEE